MCLGNNFWSLRFIAKEGTIVFISRQIRESTTRPWKVTAKLDLRSKNRSDLDWRSKNSLCLRPLVRRSVPLAICTGHIAPWHGRCNRHVQTRLSNPPRGFQGLVGPATARNPSAASCCRILRGSVGWRELGSARAGAQSPLLAGWGQNYVTLTPDRGGRRGGPVSFVSVARRVCSDGGTVDRGQ